MKLAAVLLLLLVLPVAQVMGQPERKQPAATPPLDAPALSALGTHRIGTQRIDIAVPGASTLTAQGLVSSPRLIKVRIWYPAKISGRPGKTNFTHKLPQPDGKGANFTIASLAVEGAAVFQGQRYPLVVVSHGYNGWDTFMTWLTENLATKGYVVVAIDHNDQRATGGMELALSFGNVLLHRAADQRAVIDHFVDWAAKPGDQLGRVIDAGHVGLIGYSMGGFGALATAGMDYDPASSVFAQLPADARAAIFANQAAGKPIAARIGAVVALAPFGGRPENRAWNAEAVARFAKPILMIGGTDDDIVDTKTGVAWIFDKMASNKRHFLQFRNARHNVGGNPPPPEADSDFSTREYFAEPVWRTERINAINQHFITAFLDLNLKGDTAKSAYLDVTPAISGEGQWPVAPFTNVGGQYAGDQEPGYWRGFQRRWAIGLEMQSGGPAQVKP